MASLLRSYNSALLRRPMLVQCVTAAVMFGAGDVIAQQAVEGKGKKHDVISSNSSPNVLRWYVHVHTQPYLQPSPTLNSSAPTPPSRTGCMFGPIITKWYQFLNRLKFASPTKALLYRIYLDQALLTPVGVLFFYGSMSTLEGNWQKAYERIEEAYVPTLVRNWAVFIPTQLINFSVVPPHLRMVTVGFVSLFWNTYLSVANAPLAAAAQAKALATTAALDGTTATASAGGDEKGSVVVP
ncbi:hypothetical protein EST38_g10143 [Candolleomyces aberdarensis]|uniref:Protein SYM1 n=1 Tax=Candolleomyces aberdarensis TaxID=2316362 RepID=A0A4Q2DAC2_9AGAR|nr:hypothetical protein EST38_g10143 [Candolleomyces aberdarensis]